MGHHMMAEPIEENQHEEDMGDDEDQEDEEEEEESVQVVRNQGSSGPHIAEIDEEEQ